MANLLGDLWTGARRLESARLSFPGIKLHLYGKSTARPGRKMGHLTALAATSAEARALVLRARDALSSGGPAAVIRNACISAVVRAPFKDRRLALNLLGGCP